MMEFKFEVGDEVEYIKKCATGMYGTRGTIDRVHRQDLIVVDSIHFYVSNKDLKLIRRKGMYKQGDILIDGCGGSEDVQGVIGKVYITIDEDGWAGVYTKAELDDMGFKLKSDTPIVEITLEEVAKLKGISVDKLRIKE